MDVLAEEFVKKASTGCPSADLHFSTPLRDADVSLTGAYSGAATLKLAVPGICVRTNRGPRRDKGETTCRRLRPPSRVRTGKLREVVHRWSQRSSIHPPTFVLARRPRASRAGFWVRHPGSGPVCRNAGRFQRFRRSQRLSATRRLTRVFALIELDVHSGGIAAPASAPRCPHIVSRQCGAFVFSQV